MSLQTSYERSTRNQVADLRSIDLSRGDREEPERSLPERAFSDDTTLSLRHLDVAIAITALDPDAEQSREAASCFKVSAKRLVGCSEDAVHPSADRDDPVIQRLSEALAATEAAHDL